MSEWNRYWLRSLPRHERARIIMADVRFEVAFIKSCTKIALESDELDSPKHFDEIDEDFSF